jgi:hypothetical protein
MDHPIVDALSADGYFFWDRAQWVSGASTALAAILTILMVWSITHRQAERRGSLGR